MMPIVEHDVVFPAKPDEVFAMIRRVDEFPRYVDAVESVTLLSAGTYRWKVRANGLVFSWDVAIVEEYPPHRLTWQSLNGIRNTGRYYLSALPSGGTRVRLAIEYYLPNKFLDKTLGRVAKPIFKHISAQAIGRVRQALIADSNKLRARSAAA